MSKASGIQFVHNEREHSRHWCKESNSAVNMEQNGETLPVHWDFWKRYCIFVQVALGDGSFRLGV